MKFRIVLLSIIGVLLLGTLVYNIFFENVEYVGDLYISVPVVSNDLNKYEVIKETDIKYISVYKSFAKENNLIIDSSLIVDKYAAGNMKENSFFYEGDLLDNIYDSLEYETLYNLFVPNEYQNIIYYFDYVDIWIDGVIDGLVVSEPLVENVKILYYLGNETVLTGETGIVSDIILDVPLDVNNMLSSIANKGEYNIYPVIKDNSGLLNMQINDIIYEIS